MVLSDIFLICSFAAALILILWSFKKSGHFFRCLFLSAVSGTGGIFAVNLLSTFTGVSLAVTPFTLLFSAFSGLSGVISLLIFNLFS